MVALVHAIGCVYRPRLAGTKNECSKPGGVGLFTFRVMSGYLITQSRPRNTAADLAWSRALHILHHAASLRLFPLIANPFAKRLRCGSFCRSFRRNRLVLLSTGGEARLKIQSRPR